MEAFNILQYAVWEAYFEDPFPILGLSDDWMDQFHLVYRFTQQYNKLPMLTSQDEEEQSLARWCYFQRCHRNELTNQQLAALNSLPKWHWITNRPNQEKWTRNYRLVIDFVQFHNRLPMQKKQLNPTEHRLGIWCNNQRVRKGLLQEDQIKLLEDIPGWYWRKRVSQHAKYRN